MTGRIDKAALFVLETLRRYPDNELQASDLHAEAAGRFSLATLQRTLATLWNQKAVVCAPDPDGTLWWAIDLPRRGPVTPEPAKPLKAVRPRSPRAAPPPVPAALPVAASPKVPALPPVPTLPPVPAPPPVAAPAPVAGPAPVAAPVAAPAPVPQREPPQPPALRREMPPRPPTAQPGVEIHPPPAPAPTSALPVRPQWRRPERAGPRAPASKLEQEAHAALDAARPPAVEALLDLIHRVNPTQRNVDARLRAEHYGLKNQLQSLLIRHYANQFVVEVEPADLRVIGLRHRYGPQDGCHAVLDDLDDDARAWAQFQLDTGQGEPVPRAVPLRMGAEADSPRAERGVEQWMRCAARCLAEYDYEGAREAFLHALQESDGSAGTALPLVELLVETLGDYRAALDLLPRLRTHGPGVVTMRAHLAVAAVHEGALPLAEQLLADATGPLPATAWVQLVQAWLQLGQEDKATRALSGARSCGPPTPDLLALEQHLAAQREARRAPQELHLQALADSGQWEAVRVAAGQVIEGHPDSALARRLLRRAEQEVAQARLRDALASARDHAAQAQWQAATASLAAVPATDWTEEMHRLADQARAQLRTQQRHQALRAVAEQVGRKDGTAAWFAWWSEPDAAVAAEIVASWPSPSYDWLRELRRAGCKASESVAAAQALLGVLALPDADQGAALDRAFARCPALRHLEPARQLADVHARVEAAARREGQHTALQAVAALVEAEQWQQASAMLESLGTVAGRTARQREALAATIVHGLAANAAMERCVALQQRGQWLEAGHAAQLAAGHHPHLARAQQWRALAEQLRAAARAGRRQVIFETPHAPRSRIPLGLCLRPDTDATNINERGRVVLVAGGHGFALIEIIDPETSAVVRGSIIDLGGPAQPQWMHLCAGPVLLLANTAGRCLVLDSDTLVPLRDVQLPIPEGLVCYRLMLPQPSLLWVLLGDLSAKPPTWHILDFDALRPVATCGSGRVHGSQVAGLEPPGLVLWDEAGRAEILTPRGRPHALPALVHGMPTAAVALPFDRRVACLFIEAEEDGAKLRAMLHVRPMSGSGRHKQMRWATTEVAKWLSAKTALDRGDLLAMGTVSAVGHVAMLHARPTAFGVADIKVNDITNHSALVGSHDGRRAYLLLAMSHGLWVVQDFTSLAAGAGKMLVRANFPDYRPGYVHEEVADHADLRGFLLRLNWSRHQLAPGQAEAFWDSCADDASRLLLFGQLVRRRALAVAETLRSRVAGLAEHLPRARLHLIGLQGAHENWAAARTLWHAIDRSALEPDEALHHRHLGAYLTLMTDDLATAQQEIEDVRQFGEPARPCGCQLVYWRDAVSAALQARAGTAVTVLPEVMGTLLQAEADIGAGRCHEVRTKLALCSLDAEPQLQASARLALAWLRDASPRSDDERFAEFLALGTFLDVSDVPILPPRDNLLVPGDHWSSARLRDVAKEAAERLAELAAAFLDRGAADAAAGGAG